MHPDGSLPAALKAAEWNTELRRAWGWHLDREWDHFVTLTSRNPATTIELERWLRDDFIRTLARHAQNAVPYFGVVEGTSGLRHLHLHALLAGTWNLSPASMESKWRHGNARVERYDPERGARFYLTKEFPAEAAVHWFSSSKFPPQRDSCAARPSSPSR